jgi:hypothetical protein
MKLSVSFDKTLVSYNEVVDINDLIARVVAFAHRHKYENKKVGSDTLVMQKSGIWRMLTGLSASLRISISIELDKTEVTLSDYSKEFMLKQFVLLTMFMIGASLFFAYRLPIFLIMIFPVYGAFRQYRLMEDIKVEIDNYFAR